MPAVSENQFDSLDDLFRQIIKITKDWDSVWYRGVRSAKFGLVPKVLRSTNYNENIVSVEFRRRMRVEFPSMKTDFDWLCAMQHFGVPTRLLDWSESLFPALYFATMPLSKKLNSSTIWVLNPFALVELVRRGEGVIPTQDNDIILNYSGYSFDNGQKKGVGKFPSPVVPDFIFSRLKAQNSCFTIHGSDNRPLEAQLAGVDIDDPILYKFTCNNRFISSLALSVNLLCGDPSILFPDIEGFHKWLGPDSS